MLPVPVAGGAPPWDAGPGTGPALGRKSEMLGWLSVSAICLVSFWARCCTACALVWLAASIGILVGAGAPPTRIASAAARDTCKGGGLTIAESVLHAGVGWATSADDADTGAWGPASVGRLCAAACCRNDSLAAASDRACCCQRSVVASA